MATVTVLSGYATRVVLINNVEAGKLFAEGEGSACLNGYWDCEDISRISERFLDVAGTFDFPEDVTFNYDLL